MNILIVCDVLGEANNGTTIAALNLIKYLKDQGENVRVLCADKDKKNKDGFFVVPQLYLGCLLNSILKHNNVSLSRPKKKIIKKALKDIDIVHVLIPFPLGIKACKIAKKMNIPVTASFHCQAENLTSHIFHTMNCTWINNKVYKMFYKKLYKNVNAIHYPTEFIRNTFEKAIKRKTNSYVISNGVNDIYRKKETVRVGTYAKYFNILFIGRLAKEKSHHLLIKAVSLSKYKDEIQLIFAGQGPRRKQIDKLIKKSNIRTPIINFYSRNDLIDVINSSDLYVHPAEIEIEAISCLEAISCGLVPIISDSKRSATNAFALTDYNLFKYNDPQDLADKIDYWFEHPKEKQECSEKYLGYTEQFNQDLCMRKMHNMLRTYAKEENHTNKKIIFYKDELNDDFGNHGIKAKPTPKSYKYIHKNPIYHFFAFIAYYLIAKPWAYILNKIFYRQKIVNHLTVSKKNLRGCFIYANHTLGMGDAYTPNLIFAKRNSIIVSPEATSIFGIKTLVSMVGGMPVPSTIEGFQKFMDAINKKVQKGQSITIYPEAHIWPYYTDIRNFKSVSFNYPVKLNKPCICITNTYVKKGKKYKLVSHVDGPFYPNLDLKPTAAKEDLRNKIYQMMKMRSCECEQYTKFKYININDIEIND